MPTGLERAERSAGHPMSGPRPESVGELAELYLGNILFALERTAGILDEEGRHDDAAFYRGIARVLADARGRALKNHKPPAASR